MEQQINSQVEKLDINEKSKQLIGKLIIAELFKVIYKNSYNVKNVKVVKYTQENDNRVWVEVTLLISNNGPVPEYQFRPFLDTCRMQSVNGGIALRKTYYLYSE